MRASKRHNLSLVLCNTSRTPCPQPHSRHFLQSLTHISLIAFVFAVASCNGKTATAPTPIQQTLNPQTTPPPSAITTLTVSGNAPTVGESSRFTAIGTFADGTSRALSDAQWSSSNVQVASVDAAGTVTGLGAGASSIAAQYLGVRGIKDINVAPYRVDVGADMRLFMEALFLGQGAWGAGSCPGGGVLAAWARGGPITVTISNNLSVNEREVVLRTVGQFESATNRTLQTIVRFTDESDPTPGRREVTVAKVADHRCGTNFGGCAVHTFFERGVISAVRIFRVEPISNLTVYAHELGHGLYGFCHFNLGTAVAQNPPGARPSTVMGDAVRAGRLTDDDLAAVRAVFRAGLLPGATREQFAAAGLINP